MLIYSIVLNIHPRPQAQGRSSGDPTVRVMLRVRCLLYYSEYYSVLPDLYHPRPQGHSRPP